MASSGMEIGTPRTARRLGSPIHAALDDEEELGTTMLAEEAPEAAEAPATLAQGRAWKVAFAAAVGALAAVAVWSSAARSGGGSGGGAAFGPLRALQTGELQTVQTVILEHPDSGLCLDIADEDESFEVRPRPKLKPCVSGLAQQWHFDEALGQLQNIENSKCIDAAPRLDNGDPVLFEECASSKKWYLTSSGLSHDVMKGTLSMGGFCFATAGSEGEVHMWQCKPNDRTQMWELRDTEMMQVVRTPGHRKFPGLFCWSYVMAGTAEVKLLKLQASKKVGIFQCDSSAVFSSAPAELGGGYSIATPLVNTVGADMPNCTTSTHSACNSLVFLRIWDAVLQHGQWRKQEWTLKVDGDTVFVPGRLRPALQEHTRNVPAAVENLNCWEKNIWFLGPLEIFSRELVERLADNFSSCADTLPWDFGEDLWMNECFKSQGSVERIDLNWILSDSTGHDPCADHPCGEGKKVGYHPYKSTNAWWTCYRQTTS